MGDQLILARDLELVRQHTVSRGQFLKLCGGTLIAAHLDPVALVAGAADLAATAITPVTGRPLQPGSLGAAQFRQHLTSTFVVGSEGGPIRMRLAKVIERTHDAQLEQFSLVFQPEAGTSLSEGSHRFHHPVLGQFDLYIAPIGASTNPQTMYEACFSWPANMARNSHGV